MKSYHFILCLLITGLASCQSKQQSTTVPVQSSLKAFTLKEGTLNTTMSIPGVLQPYQTVDLYAKVNGFIKTMMVDIGSEVHRGQLLMTLDAPEMTAALTQTQEDLHTKEAIYRGSKANYDRLLKTSKMPGTISPNDLDMAHAKMSADSSALLAARSAYQLSADLKNYLAVRAPFDGVISSRNVYPGAYVTPSDKNSNKPMLTLQEQAKLRLVVDVPEAATKYFSNKDTVHFTVKTLPGKQFVAVVNRMAGSLNNELRSEQMQMDIPNGNKELLPGMFAQVTLQLTNTQKTFVIPQTAVAGNSQRIFVIRVVNNKAQWIDVKKGRETTDSLEVYGALTNGSVLLKNATDEIKDNTPVKIN
ncbi:efflux RND transporter periplasmic adaptor subunit [Mucilaginibacter sp.]|uniref:efflux RND transporter periplasmic adaptor subunit n=1 Tax=Mucilaginibacter sp. TaxID=1882438 RepID=UPI0026329B4A|nr:efflux RND transporter periplasmic adaptor subunit [Mucilaginibacter sp.]MDB5029341.1 efflux transporter, family, subunit [Mucilaginibacter sp.]